MTSRKFLHFILIIEVSDGQLGWGKFSEFFVDLH